MSTNTLETSYTNGSIIDSSHLNEVTLSLLGDFVGRNSSGVPATGNNLGTLALPWGNLYCTGVILGGVALDTSQIVTKANRVVSGASTALSLAPDFLRANGAALSFDVLGLTTNLVLSINNSATTVNTDITKSGLTAAPSTNNTALVNDTLITTSSYAGEYLSGFDGITIDSVGSEISGLVGQIAAFKTAGGEIFKAFVKSATSLTNVFRGYYIDSSGNPTNRGSLSNNDTITLMKLGWIFVEDNGTTVDVTYNTPTISFTSPSSPSTGDYWFDISNQVWKRYSGTAFEIINRILVGEFVSDATNCIATRSYDFDNAYAEQNSVELEIDTTEIIQSTLKASLVNVYGTNIVIDQTQLKWNITTDLESGLTEAVSTEYYLYLSTNGETIMSDKRPYYRPDLKGFYHPYQSWRALGSCWNDGSSNLVALSVGTFNKNVNERFIIVDQKSGVDGGASVAGTWVTRDLNTTYGDLLAEVSSNQFKLLWGKYRMSSSAPSYAGDGMQSRLYNATLATTVRWGTSERVSSAQAVSTRSTVEDEIISGQNAAYEIQTRVDTAINPQGLGYRTNFGAEVYTQIKIEKLA